MPRNPYIQYMEGSRTQYLVIPNKFHFSPKVCPGAIAGLEGVMVGSHAKTESQVFDMRKGRPMRRFSILAATLLLTGCYGYGYDGHGGMSPSGMAPHMTGPAYPGQTLLEPIVPQSPVMKFQTPEYPEPLHTLPRRHVPRMQAAPQAPRYAAPSYGYAVPYYAVPVVPVYPWAYSFGQGFAPGVVTRRY